MRKFIYISIGFIILLSCGEDFFSASKDIDLSEYQGQVAINARIINADKELPFTADIIQRIIILVSRSKTVIDTTEFELIEDANMNLYADGVLIQNYSFHDSSGYYVPDVFLGIQPSTEYRLEVDVPGESLVSANIISPPKVEMENIEYIKDDIVEDDNESYDKIEIDITDPPGKNYYYIDVIHKREYYNGQDTITDFYQAEVLNINTVFEENNNLFSDELFDGENKTLEFWAERNEWDESNKIKSASILLWSLTEEEYNYINAIIRNNDANDNPFAEPTFVFSNIENGIGIFTISHVESFEVEID